MTGTGVNVVRGTLGLLAVLVWAYPVPAQSEPALQFTSPPLFQVHPDQRLWPRETGQQGNWGNKYRYFARLTARQATSETLAFAAEGQTGPASTYCHGTKCGAVSVGVLSEAEGGLLYLGVDIESPASSQIRSKFQDFPPQRVEVSVQAGQQKVYQEVRVTAPADVPDCSDYPEMNEDRYRCYYTREIIAPAFRVANSPLVAGLPGPLLQDRGEYELVFAEEFEGTYRSFDTYADNCDRGLAELDQSKWNYRQKLCRSAPQGAPCEYLADGHLHISGTTQCGPEIRTRGSFQPRYGYVEVQYTVSTSKSQDDSNYNMLMGDLSRSERYLLRTHNLNLDSLERLLTLVPWVEIDLIEHLTKYGAVISHQYRNWYPVTHHPDVRPMLTYKLKSYCRSFYVAERIIIDACQKAPRITITEGMEWTPGGYLFLRQVHGRDDTPQIIEKRYTRIAETRFRRDDRWHVGSEGDGTGKRQYLYGTAKEQYFVPLDPNDPAFHLEAVGISHAPKNIDIGGWSQVRGLGLTNRSELTIDHIRVFQPRNQYADMEPLYQ